MEEMNFTSVQVGASVRQFEQTPTIAPKIRMMRAHSSMSPGNGRASTDRRASSDAPSAVEASSSVVGGASHPDDNIDTAASVARARMLLAYPSLTEQKSSVHRKGTVSCATVMMSHGSVRRTSAAHDEVPHMYSGLDAEHEAEQDKLVLYATPTTCYPSHILGCGLHCMHVMNAGLLCADQAMHNKPVEYGSTNLVFTGKWWSVVQRYWCYRAIHQATSDLKRNAKLVSGAPNNLGFAAAIFEPAPLKSRGTTLGVAVQLLTTFLYMANYNLVIPTVDNFMEHLQVSVHLIPSTFAMPLCTLPPPLSHPSHLVYARILLIHRALQGL